MPGLLAMIGVLMLIFIKPIWKTLKNFNAFSWATLLLYLLGTTVIERGSRSIPFEGVIMTLPLLFFYLYWSQENSIFLKQNKLIESRLSASQLDVFLMSASVLISSFIMLVINSNNTDLRGWWPFVLYFSGFYGLVFGSIYALISVVLLKVNHKQHTFLFAALSLLALITGHWMPYYFVLKSGQRISTLTLLLSGIIIIHLISAAVIYFKGKSKTTLN
jgi:hypothetical protein